MFTAHADIHAHTQAIVSHTAHVHALLSQQRRTINQIISIHYIRNDTRSSSVQMVLVLVTETLRSPTSDLP